MQQYNQFFIDGKFVQPQGTQVLELVSPITDEPMAQVTLGNQADLDIAVVAAKKAFATFHFSTPKQRQEILKRWLDALKQRRQDLIDAVVEEYGGVAMYAPFSIDTGIDDVQTMIDLLDTYEFSRPLGRSTVELNPVGVVGVVIPWNASNLFICSKVSAAIAAGCTCVIKPSELSARQTQVMMECLEQAQLPAGLVNIVNGDGAVIGNGITQHPDISKITFTGSTNVGKTIARGAVDTMKRVTLELGGKSPNIILDDADLEQVIPQAIGAAFMNNGQACIAATRLLVPASKLAQVNAIAKEFVEKYQLSGDPHDPRVTVGPSVSKAQYQRVQEYIRIGLEEDKAELLVGGLGRPEGLTRGNFNRPTIFTNVDNKMRIAQEEIFGPVLCIIPYQDEAQAIAIANDTPYGLMAYVSSASRERALQVAKYIESGQVKINDPFNHDNKVPFGGVKLSGLGREYGQFGLSHYLEPKSIVG
ncbi:aldehyde dehydrogenase family protein [Psittacicella hinzii]|uniref:aldehyde dehydrogenase (NAD(+)) n=1 Tax=Psittacicella hinzii TaxID=2028575 RepID=A0A3A1YAL5_9GAMM|nr:aldehyde dehydrogenase family protein [Psittacicella hinzii]RIY34269.1 aldehyde dehydrogenase family protein [Psittacicella hinzii]